MCCFICQSAWWIQNSHERYLVSRYFSIETVTYPLWEWWSANENESEVKRRLICVRVSLKDDSLQMFLWISVYSYFWKILITSIANTSSDRNGYSVLSLGKKWNTTFSIMGACKRNGSLWFGLNPNIPCKPKVLKSDIKTSLNFMTGWSIRWWIWWTSAKFWKQNQKVVYFVNVKLFKPFLHGKRLNT